ncbi:MAG: hypothetical protein PWR10_1803 [Halanaerobiales bacterium]|nr:hypothetical protein [Halanaerobiales bacterium]
MKKITKRMEKDLPHPKEYQPKPVVYLAGSINGHSAWAVATEWRLYAAGVLETAGFKVLNPLRGRKPTDTNSKDIVERDLQDIVQANILLVEMDHDQMPYIGTSMEIRYAWERGKEIILWGRANRGSHWLKYHATAWFDDLEGALDYLREKGLKSITKGGKMMINQIKEITDKLYRDYRGLTRAEIEKIVRETYEQIEREEMEELARSVAGTD